ncbi:Endonuclease MutS2 [Castellaniella defragrans]
MITFSVLYPGPQDGVSREQAEVPEFFTDLNLDQIIGHITAKKGEYNLQPFFYRSLDEADSVAYRQEVMHDLERPALYTSLMTFATQLQAMRARLTQAAKLYYPLQKQAWFLCATEQYYEAVQALAQDLGKLEFTSRGMQALKAHADNYTQGANFQTLVADAKAARSALASIRYCIHIKGDTFTVLEYQGESDYSAEVSATFEKFRQGAAKDYRVKFHDLPDMNHIEAQVLEFVSKLFPEVFTQLDIFCQQHQGYLDETLAVFDREVQFYTAYLDYMNTLRGKGLDFCYPEVGRVNKTVFAQDTYDLALADKLLNQGKSIVRNDFSLCDKERIFIVSGPNQGGKTTFARTFGQLHYLANLGLPVPGNAARLFLYDRLFAHFEREEDIRNLRGKLEDDLVRIHRILQGATPDSIIIMNEIFTSTTLQDALFLGSRILERIVQLDLLCVCVTFIDELAHLSDTTVSMVSTIVPDNPAQRTYKVVRRPADGKSYALSLAHKYRIEAHDLEERLPS